MRRGLKKLMKMVSMVVCCLLLVQRIQTSSGQHCDKLASACDSSSEPDSLIFHLTKNKSEKFDSLQNAESLGYQSKLSRLISGALDSPDKVVSPTPNAINIGMVLVNTKKTQSFEPTFAKMTLKELSAILSHANLVTPLHFIYMTDEYSAPLVGQLVSSAVRRKLAQDVITNVYKKSIGLPPLFFTLVDYYKIKAKKPEFVLTVRNLNGTVGDDKYDEDFFYIAPLYHLAFTSLQRMIVLDCQDLEFNADISELNAEFDKMAQNGTVMGIGLDLSLHYKVMLWKYREQHPDTLLGSPGRFQGFNSGVVLYDMERMRQNQTYNRYLEPENARALLQMYLYRATLAEQDWMTNLGFTHPELFHILPCTFNAQTSIQYMSTDLVPVFDDYHYCDLYKNLKIVHLNGCGPLPEHCGNSPNDRSPKYVEGAYFNTGLLVNWDIFEKIRTGALRVHFLDD